MDDLIAFYDTPLGKKLSTVQPQITLESMSVAQQWAAEIGQKVASKIMNSGGLRERFRCLLFLTGRDFGKI